jgi:hypothetical protein
LAALLFFGIILDVFLIALSLTSGNTAVVTVSMLKPFRSHGHELESTCTVRTR